MAIALSAGLLPVRRVPQVEVLLGHLGGPFWARRDAQAWTAAKGVAEAGESPEDTARREFSEETGLAVPPGPWIDLGEVRQSRKIVRLWAIEADLDPAGAVPGEFEMEWPPRSGRLQRFPELDRLAWFTLDAAATAIVTGQLPFLKRVREAFGSD